MKTHVRKRRDHTVEEKENTLAGNDPYGDKYVLVHPLWSEAYTNSVIHRIGRDYKPLSVFGITLATAIYSLLLRCFSAATSLTLASRTEPERILNGVGAKEERSWNGD